MSEQDITTLLKNLEDERLSQVEEIEDSFVEKVADAKKRVEVELTEQMVGDVVQYNVEQAEKAQHNLLKILQELSERITQRSKVFTADKRVTFDDPLRLNFVYAQISPDLPKTIGIIVPAYRLVPDNGAGYLHERIKALTFETLLQARDQQGMEIDSINMMFDQSFAVFTVDFSCPLSLESEPTALAANYDQTAILDLLFEDAFNNDPILEHTKIHFRENGGITLRQYNLQQLMSIAEVSGAPIIDSSEEEIKTEYVSEDDAADIVFGVSRQDIGYNERHEVALHRFKQEMVYGNFRDEFNDFDMKKSGEGRTFKKDGIEDMVTGKDETISSSSGKDVVVKKVYIVPVDDSEQLVHIFPCGAYTRKDAMRKYAISKARLDRHFKYGDKFKVQEITLPGGEIVEFYPREELEHIPKGRGGART